MCTSHVYMRLAQLTFLTVGYGAAANDDVHNWLICLLFYLFYKIK